MPYFCGLDWRSIGHAVCIVDATGAVLIRFNISHDAAGLAELRHKLHRLVPAADMPIAIERPSGLIVDALVEAGHPVVPTHPPLSRPAGRVTPPRVARAMRVTRSCFQSFAAGFKTRNRSLRLEALSPVGKWLREDLA